MGFDLHLAAPEQFLEWDKGQWDAYWESSLAAEGDKLGNATSVGLALAAITRNLEPHGAGSRFPLLLRLDSADPAGRHHDEVPHLLAELIAARDALAFLPVNASTSGNDDDVENVRRRSAGFEPRNGSLPPANLYGLYRHFFDTFESVARRAIDSAQGIVASV